MNCGEAETLIATRLDGELDPVRSRALDAHLAACTSCTAELASLTDLVARVAAAAPYHRAPAQLRLDVDRMLADGVLARQGTGAWFGAMQGRRAFTGGALAGAATLAVGWLGVTGWLAHREDGDLARTLVEAHVRATLGDHLVAVVSSDQHTVKPWLSARLDYSPPIDESPIEGVTLVGARIEAIGGQRVATLVYRYRAHAIDVFVRPTGSVATSDAAQTIRGFNIAEASGAGMEWRAVSDASLQILRPLVDKLAQTAPH